jgi:hypothetical protein
VDHKTLKTALKRAQIEKKESAIALAIAETLREIRKTTSPVDFERREEASSSKVINWKNRQIKETLEEMGRERWAATRTALIDVTAMTKQGKRFRKAVDVHSFLGVPGAIKKR